MTVIFCVTNNTHCTFLKYFGTVIGECGSEPWQLHNPRGVAVSKTGQIIVANWDNNNLLVYDLVRHI